MTASEVTNSSTGRVYLVGAGPGDPELLTQKAVRVLAQADVVLHDDLVPPAILKVAGPQALVVNVGKRCGSKKITQAAIHEWMISSALRGLSVVRLKSGDPMIFGRAGEEMDALRAAQVPFEAVPGVTAASSAAALLEVSLTDRRFASKLIVLSGHHAAGERPERWIDDAALPEDATGVIYMPGRNLAETAALLLESGVSPTMPCVVVSGASQPEAGYRAARLSELARMATDPAPTPQQAQLAGDPAPSPQQAQLAGDPAPTPQQAQLAGDPAPRVLLVGRTFEAVLVRGKEPEESSLPAIEALLASIQPR